VVSFRPGTDGQGGLSADRAASLPIWLGVAVTPQIIVRAGQLGLPLMVRSLAVKPPAIPSADRLYRETGGKGTDTRRAAQGGRPYARLRRRHDAGGG